MLMFADDGYCVDQTTQSSCDKAVTTGNYFKACDWHHDGGYCAFHKPSMSFLTIILLSFLVTSISVPFYQLIRYLTSYLDKFCQSVSSIPLKFKKKSLNNGINGLLMRVNDEFHNVQTFKSNVLRSARLEVIRKKSDNCSAYEEILHMMIGKVQSLLKSVGHENKVWMTVVMDRLIHSRNRSEYMQHVMNILSSSSEEKEEFLMSSFIVDSFHGYKRLIATKYFLDRYNKSSPNVMMEFLRISIFIVIMTVMVYYIAYFSTIIGSRSTDLWLIVVLLSIIDDLIIVQPLVIWIKWAMIDAPVAKDARELVDCLKKRSRFIMMRSTGYMLRHTEALIQHFNSACRAARMYPSLPIARLLFSLNDSDVPQ
jgi:hypothetical protein